MNQHDFFGFVLATGLFGSGVKQYYGFSLGSSNLMAFAHPIIKIPKYLPGSKTHPSLKDYHTS